MEEEILYDKDIECPICNNKFIAKKIRNSRLRLLRRDEDFLSYYRVGNPIKYGVTVCSDCGYAAYGDSFEDINIRNIDSIKNNISSHWKQRDFDGLRDLDKSIEAYKIALINYGCIQKSNLEVGNLLINIAWLYRMKNEVKQETRFMKLAREKFIVAYDTESLLNTSTDESKLSYLIGELSRRLEKKEDAVSWFNTCLSLPETKMNPNIDNLAREQWRTSREMEE